MGTPQESISVAIRTLDRSIRRHLKLASPSGMGDITPGNVLILLYLDDMEKRGTPVFQKDIEKSLGITRSTMSRILSLMESKGLISRSHVDDDARFKQVTLTPKSHAIIREMSRTGSLTEIRLLDGFSPQETAQLAGYLARMQRNIDAAGEAYAADATRGKVRAETTPSEENIEYMQETAALERLDRVAAGVDMHRRSGRKTQRNVNDSHSTDATGAAMNGTQTLSA